MAIADFDNVGGFALLPAGTYLVRISKVERKQAKSSGAPMLAWTAIVVEGPQMGSMVGDYTTLTDAAIWKATKLIKFAGVDIGGRVDTDSSLFTGAVNACVGQTMYWNLTQETTTQGNLVNKVDGYSPDPNQQKVSLTQDDVPSFLKE